MAIYSMRDDDQVVSMVIKECLCQQLIYLFLNLTKHLWSRSSKVNRNGWSWVTGSHLFNVG